MALLEKLSKKEKDYSSTAAGVDTDSHVKYVRQQLSEQLKCLDVRLDNHVTMLQELQDFYRRRSEVELEYSRGMEKLVRQITARHKTERQKRESWSGYSTHHVWQSLLETTRRLSKDHGILGEVYGSQMSNRLVELMEDLQRVHKRCHEMALGGHDELIKVLTELHSSMKTYQLYHSECQQAEAKVRHVESQRVKLERQQSTTGGSGGGGMMTAGPKAVVLNRRFKNVEKQSEKKQAKYIESGFKAVKARNEYILCLEAANAAVQKYYSDDLHDLISTMDYGYHNTLSRAILTHLSADGSVLRSRQSCINAINQQIQDLDQQSDKHAFLETYGHLFSQPRLFEFQPHRGDETSELTAEKFIQDELFDRMNAISERLNVLRLESEEIWKTLEVADNKLLDLTTRKDYDMTYLFQDDYQPVKSPQQVERDKLRSDRIETENFYLTKFRDYQTRNNLMIRLQAKYNSIEKALTGVSCPALTARPDAPPKPKRRRALGKTSAVVRPKLFGGTIQEYVETTGEDIPLIIRSCVRIINLYGMHHQGVFRIPGPQNEVNEFKNEFERGKDPLPDKVDGKDINSVAGVLKLYFRELKEPLFPTHMFDDLMTCSNNCRFNTPEHVSTSVGHVRSLLSTLPKAVFVVMKYLFAFLNHLSEFSDENMMDPYNLAICFGPTLMRVPVDRDPVQFQPHIIELVRNIVIHQEDIFILDDATLTEGVTLYERCLVEVEGRDDSVENLFEDDEVTVDLPTDEDAKEALAMYDFEARSHREVSFHKGDVLFVFDKVSADWWEGTTSSNQRGLIPDKFIILRHREKSEPVSGLNRLAMEDKFKSTESLPVAKTCRLSLHPLSSDDELSASHPNVSLGRVMTPVAGNGNAGRPCSAMRPCSSEEDASGDELKITVSLEDDSRLQSEDSGTTDSSSRGSMDEILSPLGNVSGGSRVEPFEPHKPKRRTRSTDCHPSESSRHCSDDWENQPEITLRTDTSSSPEPSRGRFVGHDHSLASSLSSSQKSPEPRSHTVGKLQRISAIDRTMPEESVSDDRARHCLSHDINDDGRTTEDLALDIDSALAEVMSEIERLGLSCIVSRDDSCTTSSSSSSSNMIFPSTGRTSITSTMSNRQDFKGTPDLVIGLPVSSSLQPPSPKSTNASLSSDHQAPVTSKQRSSTPEEMTYSGRSPQRVMTTAEVFANSNQCTIKKGSGVVVGVSSSGGTSEDVRHGDVVSSSVAVACGTHSSHFGSIRSDSVHGITKKPVPAVRTKSVDEHAVPLSGVTVSRSPIMVRSMVPKPSSVVRHHPEQSSWKAVPTSSLTTEFCTDEEFVRSMVPTFSEHILASSNQSANVSHLDLGSCGTTFTTVGTTFTSMGINLTPFAGGVSTDAGHLTTSGNKYTTDLTTAGNIIMTTALPSSSRSRPSPVVTSSNIATLPRSSTASERQGNSFTPLPTTTVGAVKPAVKVKPPVMKKPTRAGEMIKRLQESIAQHDVGGGSGGDVGLTGSSHAATTVSESH